MQENPPNPESNIKSAIDAATGLVKAVPIYQDVVQPSAKQIGESLSIITKTVNIALAPLKALVWGYDKIEEFITLKISEKLKDIPPEKITTPPLQVAGPSADALRYVGHNENLRELFANLIATSMNIDTVHKAHPAYVDIIKNLTSDEAILLTAFAKADSYPCIEVQSKVKRTNDYHVIQKSFSNLHNIASMSMPELLPSYLDKNM